MTYTITVTEVSKLKMEIEAEDYETALMEAQREYWKNPAHYEPYFEPEDTRFE